MNFTDFKRVLTTFAARAADVDLDKGRLLVEVGEQVIDAVVTQRAGEIHVRESDGAEMSATDWIVRRVARLDLLAERILSYIPEEGSFVEPRGVLLDALDESPEEMEVERADTLNCLHNVLDRRPAGTCSVLYLTSDAGEGKTTVISALARRQASAYKAKRSDWLLIPVALGGRPFLRFDEVVVAALVNRFRFSRLYYDAFVELVRLGVLVPALDGFEEMFVENTAGDAVSALANLVRAFESQGSLLIAARKAYFEYRSLGSQARLLDALQATPTPGANRRTAGRTPAAR